MKVIEGGVTAAQGFEAAGVEASIKYQNRKDMSIMPRLSLSMQGLPTPARASRDMTAADRRRQRRPRFWISRKMRCWWRPQG